MTIQITLAVLHSRVATTPYGFDHSEGNRVNAHLVTRDENTNGIQKPQEEFMKWKHQGLLTPNKVTTQALAAKVLAIVFCNSKSALLTIFPPFTICDFQQCGILIMLRRACASFLGPSINGLVTDGFTKLCC